MLSHLQQLDPSCNELIGRMPSQLGSGQNLVPADSSRNNLTGSIPPFLANLSSLDNFVLRYDNLEGSIPQDLGRLVQLKNYCFKQSSLFVNQLEGGLPPDLGITLQRLQALGVAANSFIGPLPSTLLNESLLFLLECTNNYFTGHLPTNLGSLTRLRGFADGDNNLESTLAILTSLTNCTNLQSLVLGYNPLRGHLAEPISNFSTKLITSIPGFNEIRGFIPSGISKLTNILVVNLSSNHFKGSIPDFLSNYVLTYKSFVAEYEAPRVIRRRNIVKILIAQKFNLKGNYYLALFVEFMSNGSLEENDCQINRPCPCPTELKHFPEANIAIDVASAVDYLHNQCQNPIVHFDPKPSDILLDDNMCAYISDFGLARMLAAPTFETSLVSLEGTLGYTPPEYDLGETPFGLAFFGIILLELFTERRPADGYFAGDCDLHDFVKIALPELIVEILDPSLLSEQWKFEQWKFWTNHYCHQLKVLKQGMMHECLASILRICINCSSNDSNECLKRE
ncbi:unnamed protein product [Coffea canephora]|uniref:Protein kinase domain-containing protein n=1 Tax=Coffea canephora TaxID=49390 RepID=A0A068V2B5_COFCA|nr:unnamed protein product [Coffea canephora]